MVYALIIDDDPNNIEVLQILLRMQGVESVVLDPRQLQDYREHLRRADVIFLDLAMPYLDGYEVFEVLQKEVDPVVPIIACTVHISEINRVRELGFRGFLGKPLDALRFPDQLARILNGEPVWEP